MLACTRWSHRTSFRIHLFSQPAPASRQSSTSPSLRIQPSRGTSLTRQSRRLRGRRNFRPIRIAHPVASDSRSRPPLPRAGRLPRYSRFVVPLRILLRPNPSEYRLFRERYETLVEDLEAKEYSSSPTDLGRACTCLPSDKPSESGEEDYDLVIRSVPRQRESSVPRGSSSSCSSGCEVSKEPGIALRRANIYSQRRETRVQTRCLRVKAQKCTEPVRPRPATQLTFAEALATWGAINLGSSVLGAVGTLWNADERVNPDMPRAPDPAPSSISSTTPPLPRQ